MMRSKLFAIAFGLMIAPALCLADTPLSRFLKEGRIEGSSADAEIDSKTSAAIAERAFGSVLREALARGLEPKIVNFDPMAQTLGIPKFKKGDFVRDVLVEDDGGFRSVLIRVRKDGSRDVVLTNARQEEEIQKVFFYVTSSDGRLLDTYYGQTGVRAARVDSRRYANAHKAEIEFWHKWEQDVHRDRQ